MHFVRAHGRIQIIHASRSKGMRLILSGFLCEANSVKLKGKLRACEEITPLVAICKHKKLRQRGSKGENEARFFAPRLHAHRLIKLSRDAL